jgi:thymidylate synthase (FAD)
MLKDIDAPENALYPLEDGIGFVALIESMGDDTNIVNSARTSFGKRSNLLNRDRNYFKRANKGWGEEHEKDPEVIEETRKLEEAWDKDFKLIKYLLKHKHETPLESNCLVFLIKAPIFIARQHFRHRISSYSEISGRYVEVKDEFYIPTKFRKQSPSNRQASIDDGIGCALEEHSKVVYSKAMTDSFQHYQELLKAGVCREQARAVLPLATYTQYQWTCNLRSFLHFIKLRDHSGAQWEIACMARAMLQLVKPVFPYTIKAWEELNK